MVFPSLSKMTFRGASSEKAISLVSIFPAGDLYTVDIDDLVTLAQSCFISGETRLHVLDLCGQNAVAVDDKGEVDGHDGKKDVERGAGKDDEKTLKRRLI